MTAKTTDSPYANWLFSVGCMIIVPCLPLGIEAAKHAGDIKPESYYLTGAVLAASYGLASLHNIFRFGYICLFVGTIALDFQPENGPQWFEPEWAGRLMAMVAVLHIGERFMWHVVLNRSFPDWLEGD